MATVDVGFSFSLQVKPSIAALHRSKLLESRVMALRPVFLRTDELRQTFERSCLYPCYLFALLLATLNIYRIPKQQNYRLMVKREGEGLPQHSQ